LPSVYWRAYVALSENDHLKLRLLMGGNIRAWPSADCSAAILNADDLLDA
jgi:hypothetical protein